MLSLPTSGTARSLAITNYILLVAANIVNVNIAKNPPIYTVVITNSNKLL